VEGCGKEEAFCGLPGNKSGTGIAAFKHEFAGLEIQAALRGGLTMAGEAVFVEDRLNFFREVNLIRSDRSYYT
jgi:hypothetical protein